MKLGAVLLEVVRNDFVESVHAGHLIAIDKSGTSILEIGDLDAPIFPRSAVKGLQAAAMLRSGLRVTPQQLALICASHAGSPEHLATAKSILTAAGVDESALMNTPDRPLDTAERFAWGDKAPSSLAANCSGKHAGMVATCVVNNWDLSSYLHPDHPLQRGIRDEFETLSGEKVGVVGVDGCGAPLFALSLRGLLRAITKLVDSEDPIHREVFNACRSHPHLVSGTGRLPTTLMSKVDRLFVKDGAEGVFVIAQRDGGAIAWKMSDGSQRGAATLAVASLSRIGIELELPAESVLGGGRVVGEIRASRILRNE